MEPARDDVRPALIAKRAFAHLSGGSPIGSGAGQWASQHRCALHVGAADFGVRLLQKSQKGLPGF
jgi:hypothetical protein